MSEEKRYYWLKLKRDFFKRHDIKIVEAMPNGKDYVLFYLKLLLESVDHEGQLRFSETIPYDESMLAVITNTNIDVVRSAMKIFVQLNMIEVTDDRTIYMEEAARMLGFEGWGAERVRKHRKEQELLISALHCNSDVTKCNVEKEKELEIDKEIEPKADKPPKTPKDIPCLSPLDDALKRFAEHRKKLKSPMTENAVSLLVKKLATLSKSEEVQIAIIDQSILNGWKGVFELKDQTSQGRENKPTHTEGSAYKL